MPQQQKVSPDGADVILRDDFHVGGWEDPDHGVSLALVPVGVNLALHVDQVALLEAKLTLVLRLELRKKEEMRVVGL